MSPCLHYCVFALLCLLDGSAHAVNLAFMPGDAYFISNLTEASLDGFDDDKIVLKYHYDFSYATLGGYAGFELLRIEGDTQKLSTRVREAYRLLREDIPLKKTVYADGKELENNGFTLLVYNRSIDWSEGKINLGLKYNERWMNLPEEAFEFDEKLNEKSFRAKAKLRAHRYCPLLKMVDAIAEDWRRGPEVEGLKASGPAGVGWGCSGPPIETPAVALANDIQIVIVPDSTLKQLYRKNRRAYFLAIADDGVTKWGFNKAGELRSEAWPPAEATDED